MLCCQVTFETRIIDVLEMFISLEVPVVPVVHQDTSHLADIFCKSDVIVSSLSLFIILCFLHPTLSAKA